LSKYTILGWDLAIARYQPRPCLRAARGLCPTFSETYFVFARSIFSEIFLAKIFLVKIFFSEIFLGKIFFSEIFLGKMFFSEIFVAKIFFFENIFGENIIFTNIFGENIFSYPSPIWLPYKQPLPLLSSSSVIFEVECDERTYRLDAHTYCLFYCIRLSKYDPTIFLKYF